MTRAFVVLVVGLGGCSSHPKVLAPPETQACTFAAKRESAGVRAQHLGFVPGGIQNHGPDLKSAPLVVDIAPGEAACLGLERRSSKITFQMSSDGSGVTLRTRNPYAEVLTFEAMVYLEGDSDGGYPSSTCPVKPGAVGHELWEEPIQRVVLSRFELHDEASAPTTCE